MNHQISTLLAAVLSFGVVVHCEAAPPTDVTAFFREGQTFLTWTEDGSAKGESYRVYRHAEPITAGNLAKAKLLAEVPEGSSKFQEMWQRGKDALLDPGRRDSPAVRGRLIPRLVIEPVAGGGKCKMLDEGTGLFVWTAKEAKPVKSYYAVTTVAGGAEDKTVAAANSAGPVEEVKQPIGAVKYYVEMGKDKRTGKESVAREWYIMWMDYEL